jgi:hypothetical protein
MERVAAGAVAKALNQQRRLPRAFVWLGTNGGERYVKYRFSGTDGYAGFGLFCRAA